MKSIVNLPTETEDAIGTSGQAEQAYFVYRIRDCVYGPLGLIYHLSLLPRRRALRPVKEHPWKRNSCSVDSPGKYDSEGQERDIEWGEFQYKWLSRTTHAIISFEYVFYKYVCANPQVHYESWQLSARNWFSSLFCKHK